MSSGPCDMQIEKEYAEKQEALNLDSLLQKINFNSHYFRVIDWMPPYRQIRLGKGSLDQIKGEHASIYLGTCEFVKRSTGIEFIETLQNALRIKSLLETNNDWNSKGLERFIEDLAFLELSQRK